MFTTIILTVAFLLSYLITVTSTNIVRKYIKRQLLNTTEEKLGTNVSELQRGAIQVLYDMMKNDYIELKSLKYIRVFTLTVLLMLMNPYVILLYLIADTVLHYTTTRFNFIKEVEMPILSA